MPIIITSPEYSFFQLNPPLYSDECNAGRNVCLPVRGGEDLMFQFQITHDNEIGIQDLINADNNAIQFILCSGTGIELINYTLTNGLYFNKYRTGAKELTYTWQNSIPEIDLPNKNCVEFKIKISATVDGETILQEIYSNCFYVDRDNCYSSVLKYRSTEDSNDFRYCDATDFYNAIRLPLYLAKPQFKDVERNYTYANGVTRVLNSVSSKEYEGFVDYFNEMIHEKIKIALSSDSKFIFAERYSGGVNKNGDYVINWEFDEQQTAPAGFKVIATPYDVKNDNCGYCDDSELEGCVGLADLITEQSDTDDTWQIDVTGCTFVTPPVSGTVHTIQLYMRETGSGSTYTFLGTLTFNHTGALISVPNPFEIPAIPDSWDEADLKIVHNCPGVDDLNIDRNNPDLVCGQPDELNISDISNNSVSVDWAAVHPTPEDFYDWELYVGATPTGSPVQSDTGFWVPGSTVLLGIFSLTANTQYYFRVRSSCGDGSYSAWSSDTFTTLA